MITQSFLLFALVSLFAFPGCSPERSKPENILVTINDYHLSYEKFNTMLAEEVKYSPYFKLTDESKKEFLEEIIRKELLVQEAKKRELDRKRVFVKSIERYWESTLIRNLIDIKSDQIDTNILVSEEEIYAYHQKLKSSDQSLSPLKDIYEEIKQEVKEDKKNILLKSWLEDLRKKADITVNEKLLLSH